MRPKNSTPHYLPGSARSCRPRCVRSPKAECRLRRIYMRRYPCRFLTSIFGNDRVISSDANLTRRDGERIFEDRKAHTSETKLKTFRWNKPTRSRQFLLANWKACCSCGLFAIFVFKVFTAVVSSIFYSEQTDSASSAQEVAFSEWISNDGSARIPPRCVANISMSASCPWASRTIIFRKLKGSKTRSA